MDVGMSGIHLDRKIIRLNYAVRPPMMTSIIHPDEATT
jgi:hypothetical protein